MKKISGRMIWGVILILLGVVFLLQQLNVIASPLESVVMVLLGAGGLVFLYVYFRDPDQWWAVIPGFALVGISLVGLNSLWNVLPGGDWEGGLFLGLLGLAFWLVYFRGQVDWWAIIPGGVLMTLALVAGLDPWLDEDGALFFLGLAVTFGLVALLPGKRENTGWALIPAGVLAVLGIVQLPELSDLMTILWPIGLILVGAYIMFRNWK